MTLTTHTRVTVQLDEDLDDISTGAAEALTDMALALLLHADKHHGGATRRLVRSDGRLDLWLHDPECSPACLCRSAQLPSTAGPDHTHPGDVRLVMDPGPEGGLHLHWALSPVSVGTDREDALQETDTRSGRRTW